MVNGNTWPFQTVERRRYRFRFLDGCQARFLILDFSRIPGVEVWQIGNEGGFLAAPVNLTATNGNQLLMGNAERADLIVDFTNVALGNYVLGNVGPDEPYGGGVPVTDFQIADPDTTAQIMQFRVVPAVASDPTTPPQFLRTSRPSPRCRLQLSLVDWRCLRRCPCTSTPTRSHARYRRWRSQHRPSSLDDGDVGGSDHRESGHRCDGGSGSSTTARLTLTPCTSTK